MLKKDSCIEERAIRMPLFLDDFIVPGSKRTNYALHRAVQLCPSLSRQRGIPSNKLPLSFSSFLSKYTFLATSTNSNKFSATAG